MDCCGQPAQFCCFLLRLQCSEIQQNESSQKEHGGVCSTIENGLICLTQLLSTQLLIERNLLV